MLSGKIQVGAGSHSRYCLITAWCYCYKHHNRHLRAERPALMFESPLSEFDPEVAAAIDGEISRQRGTLEMIASENFVPRAVLQAQGSVLTN